MRPWLGMTLLVACSFTADLPPGASSDASMVDAPPDALPDAMLQPPCSVGVTAKPGTDRGRVGGGGGGNNFPPLACNGDDVIVGIGVRMSDGTTLYNARSAHGLTIACAAVSIDRDTGTGTTGTVQTFEVMGSGAEGWSPSTQSPIAMCPPGTVVNGLQAHTGPNGNLFTNVRFRCATLDGDAATTASQVIYVEGSLSEPDGVDTVNCDANEIVVQLANRTGSGFDSANVFCSPARCL